MINSTMQVLIPWDFTHSFSFSYHYLFICFSFLFLLFIGFFLFFLLLWYTYYNTGVLVQPKLLHRWSTVSIEFQLDFHSPFLPRLVHPRFPIVQHLSQLSVVSHRDLTSACETSLGVVDTCCHRVVPNHRLEISWI
jgi:hypothetical protein